MIVSRIIKKKWFLQMLMRNEFTFASPSTWDDPWDSMFFVEWVDGIKESFVNIFASCWRQAKETDLTWKAYAPDGDGIMVMADTEPFVKHFEKELKLLNSEAVLLHQNVKYLNDDEFEDLEKAYKGEQQTSFTKNIENIRTVFYKRQFYRDETEWRCLLDFSICFGQVVERYNLHFNPNELITEIILDPRFSKEEIRKTKDQIRKLGFVNTISQSKISEKPNIW